jgi:hypothetical protein
MFIIKSIWLALMVILGFFSLETPNLDSPKEIATSFSVFGNPDENYFAGGTGSPENPFQVETLEQLQTIGLPANLDKHFIQAVDINSSQSITWNDGKGFIPIGDFQDKFQGSYDGNGYKIINLFINRPEDPFAGLFGVTENAVLKNITLDSIDISGKLSGSLVYFLGEGSIVSNVLVNGSVSSISGSGGIVYQNMGLILESISNATVTSSNPGAMVSFPAGGLAGLNSGSIKGSAATGLVSGRGPVGGLIGYNQGTVKGCFASGDVTGWENIGGLIGGGSGAILDSYATGDVLGVDSVGGLVGLFSGNIFNSFSSGNVNATGSAAGGFLGAGWPNIENSYSLGNVSGNNLVGGFVGISFILSQIKNSFSAGQVQGNTIVGGFSGEIYIANNIQNCYYDLDLSNYQAATGEGSSAGINPLLTGEMTGIQAYEYMTGFPFGSLWKLTPGYPALDWEDKEEIFPHVPGSPVLLLPSNGIENQLSIIDLSWVKPAFTQSYVLQISADYDFVELTHDIQDIETSGLFVSDLEYSSTYYWRVKAINPAGHGTWSEAWSFSTINLPDPPILIIPENGSQQLSLDINLVWQALDSDEVAHTYAVQISLDEDFSVIEFDYQGLEDTTLVVPGINYSTQYYWRINSSNQAGTGPWSEVWNFSTIEHFEMTILSGESYCAADSLSIRVFLNAEFSENNLFSVELSDLEGSFDQPVLLHTIQTNQSFDLILSLPDTIILGVTYNIRVKSSSPHAFSQALPIIVFDYPDAEFQTTPELLCWGKPAEIVYLGNENETASFNWNFDGGVIISGQGAGPYQVSWYDSGNKTIFLTLEKNGCISSNNANIFVASQTPSIPICMVTVNESNKNMIIFETPKSNSYQSFAIYKESSQSGIYNLIGTQPANGPGYFVDINSNPAQHSSRYKISAVDTCGYETALSDFHKTMHLTINAGVNGAWNLIWDKYEGFDYSTFNIFRGTSESEFQLIAELPSNLFTFSDLAPPAGAVFYQIEVTNPYPCDVDFDDPAKKFISTSRSNLANSQQATSVLENDFDKLVIWPNPTTGLVNITSNFKSPSGQIEILTLCGKILRKIPLQSSNLEIDLSDLTEGIYILRLRSINRSFFGRIIKL